MRPESDVVARAEGCSAPLTTINEIDQYCISHSLSAQVWTAAKAVLNSLSFRAETFDNTVSTTPLYTRQENLNLVLLVADKRLEERVKQTAVRRRINSYLCLCEFEKRVALEQDKKRDVNRKKTVVLNHLVEESSLNGTPRTRRQIRYLHTHGRCVNISLQRYGFGGLFAMGLNVE